MKTSVFQLMPRSCREDTFMDVIGTRARSSAAIRILQPVASTLIDFHRNVPLSRLVDHSYSGSARRDLRAGNFQKRLCNAFITNKSREETHAFITSYTLHRKDVTSAVKQYARSGMLCSDRDIITERFERPSRLRKRSSRGDGCRRRASPALSLTCARIDSR